MARLLIHVEGETEETFVNEVLAPHLYRRGFTKVSPRLLGNARNRDRRGGIRSWESARREILNHLKEDRECFSTTMVDYYALPQAAPKGWPGRQEAGQLPFSQKAITVQSALYADVSTELGDEYDANRFIPYVMMHEFEALLFSNCTAFATGIGHAGLATQFQEIRDAFSSPEEINDSPYTAPSRRVEQIVEGYEKPFHGTLAILEIGLDPIRAECPNFAQWLRTLEDCGR